MIEVKPLKKIPEPPNSYVEMKCALNGIYEDDMRIQAHKRFFKKFSDFVGEIRDYHERLLKIRKHNFAEAEYALAKDEITYEQDDLWGTGFDPIELVHIKGTEKNQWMLLWDFDFRRKDGVLQRQKIFIPLNPERLLGNVDTS